MQTSTRYRQLHPEERMTIAGLCRWRSSARVTCRNSLQLLLTPTLSACALLKTTGALVPALAYHPNAETRRGAVEDQH